MMISIKLIGVIGVVTFGYFLVDAFLYKLHVLEKLSLGFLIGIGVFTFMLFLANIAGVPYRLDDAILILLLLNLITFTATAVRRKKSKLRLIDFSIKTNKAFLKFSKFEKVLISIDAFVLLSALISNIYWPVRKWDAIAVYDFRAKSFAVTGFMQEAIGFGRFTNYPLLTSLSHTWMYLLGFSSPMIIYFLFYLSGAICLYFLLSRHVAKKVALFSTSLFIISGPFFRHSGIAYTNMPYSIYLALGYFYLYDWLDNKNIFFVGISTILVAMSTWTRFQEPFWIPAVIIILSFPFIFKKYRECKRVALLALVVLVPYFTWSNFLKNYLAAPGGYLVGDNFGLFTMIAKNISLNRSVEILGYLYKNTISPHSLLIILFLLTLPLLRRGKLPEGILALIFIVFLGLIFIGTYIFSIDRPDLWLSIGNSTERMTMFFIPYLIFYITLVLYRVFGKTKVIKKITN